jgi:hypothetical protein
MLKRKLSILMSGVLLLTAFLYGCGSSTKEGTGAATPVNVGDTPCIQCHSPNVDPLTGESIVVQYVNTSPHKNSATVNNGNGCESCHGGGSQHFSVGPLPFPNPNAGNGLSCASCHKDNRATNAPTRFADSKHANVNVEGAAPCNRCHSHEGAVLSDFHGLTGSKDIMDNPAYQAAVPFQKVFSRIKCSTCHQHGAGLRIVKARDAAGNVVDWNPGMSSKVNHQFNLCTSCHGLKTFDGSKVMASGTTASGTAAVGHHENIWYRIIATTHLNNMDNEAAGGISGYVLRMGSGAKPNTNTCFDCHGHEAKTNTNRQNPYVTSGSYAYDPANATNYTEWAQAAHAGGLLTAKYNAAGADARTVEQVDLVMNAIVTPLPFITYDWSSVARQACQRCHTATGAANFMSNPKTYDQTANDFSHLAGWTTTNKASKQREVIYCWACHSNAGSGVLRTPGAFTASYNFQGAPAKFPDIGASNVCVTCHSGRESGETITALTDFTNVGFKNSHYRAAAGLMYVKSGFTAFIDPNTPIGTSTYGKSLTSDADGGALTSTHRKLGTTAINGDSHNPAVFTPGNFDANGPCVTCHMTAAGRPNRITSHSWKINANAYNQVCINCHTSEIGVPLTADNFHAIFLKPNEEIFQDALKLAQAILLSRFNIKYDAAAHPYFYDLTKDPTGKTPVTDWTRGGTADGMKVMGACYNMNLLNRDPASYAHARTYARRLLYDTIDFLDDGIINLSAGATAVAFSPAIYGKGAKAFTGAFEDRATTLAPGTTEAMTYIIGWSRATGAWNAVERP